jgi:predicted esterase
MKEGEVSFQFRARYYKTGEINEHTRQVWFVLHGYGQLAAYFIRKFSVLTSHHICVIAPEGLSRFYLSEVVSGAGRASDRVGATWMTKENRSMDIENYLTYLDTVYKTELEGRTIPVTILGFSQGSATASRWALSKNISYDRLILWAGIFPPDMNFQHGHEILKKKRVHLVYGKRDPFLSDARFTEMELLVSKLGVAVTEVVFDGEHEIDDQTLLKFVSYDDLPS